MPDVFKPQKRSQVMSRIRGRGNKDTELKLIALMRAHGIAGWRRGSKLPGRPDFVFPQARLAVFVDGCFWHGCPIHATWPKNNADFWRTKILTSQKRDRAVTRELKRRGWRVLRIWEHALARKHEARAVGRLRRALGGNNAAQSPEPGVWSQKSGEQRFRPFCRRNPSVAGLSALDSQLHCPPAG